MRQLCPNCGLLSSEDTIVCGYCGTSFLAPPQAYPTESAASPQDAMPAPQPDEFDVIDSGNELTITWGMGTARIPLAVGYVVVSLVLFSLNITTLADAFDLILSVLLLLGSSYWLLAMYANRTTLRLSDEEWVIWRGPVPLPSPDFYYRSERRIDPCKYEAVVAVKDPGKPHSWGGLRDLWDIFFGLMSWLVHQGTKDARVTYTLYGRTPSGVRRELLTGLKDGQARYLAGELQVLLDARVQPAEATSATAQDTAVQAATAEHVLDSLAEAAADGVPSDVDGTKEAEPFVSCLSCGAANPADSAFCGECGTVLDVVKL